MKRETKQKLDRLIAAGLLAVAVLGIVVSFLPAIDVAKERAERVCSANPDLFSCRFYDFP